MKIAAVPDSDVKWSTWYPYKYAAHCYSNVQQ